MIFRTFDTYWNEEQQKAFKELVKEENFSDKTQKIIEDYLFAEREPLRDEVLELMEGNNQPF